MTFERPFTDEGIRPELVMLETIEFPLDRKWDGPSRDDDIAERIFIDEVQYIGERSTPKNLIRLGVIDVLDVAPKGRWSLRPEDEVIILLFLEESVDCN